MEMLPIGFCLSSYSLEQNKSHLLLFSLKYSLSLKLFTNLKR